MCNIGYAQLTGNSRLKKKAGPEIAYKFAYDKGKRYKNRFIPIYRTADEFHYGMEAESYCEYCYDLKYPSISCSCGFYGFYSASAAHRGKVNGYMSSYSMDFFTSRGNHSIADFVLLIVEFKNIAVYEKGFRAKHQTVLEVVKYGGHRYYQLVYPWQKKKPA